MSSYADRLNIVLMTSFGGCDVAVTVKPTLNSALVIIAVNIKENKNNSYVSNHIDRLCPTPIHVRPSFRHTHYL